MIGNVTRDAELKFLPNGSPKLTFSLATNRRWKDRATEEWKEEVTYHNILHWGGENLANFLVKGKQLAVSGRLSNRKYEKDGVTHYITEVIADDILLLGGGGSQQEAAPVSAPRASRPISQSLGVSQDDLSDIPF